MATELIEIEQKDILKKEVKSCCSCNCSCNIKQPPKEYIQRAQRNYRLRKLQNDPNFKEFERQKKHEYIENNREKHNEGRKLYMREYRAKKQAEKLASSKQTNEQTTEEDNKQEIKAINIS
jgi:hypothetical protein